MVVVCDMSISAERNLSTLDRKIMAEHITLRAKTATTFVGLRVCAAAEFVRDEARDRGDSQTGY
jgi:hypothetical protein